MHYLSRVIERCVFVVSNLHIDLIVVVAKMIYLVMCGVYTLQLFI
jgi:hypothetical protein